MSKETTMDLTTGSPIEQLFLFSIPLVLGTIFQQLYSFADTVIVGRFIGVSALAAVGTTYSLNFLILGFVQGLCVGFGILISQSFGAHDRKELQTFFVNGVILAVVIGAVLTVATVLMAEPLLKLIRTPEDILGMAVDYIRIIFLGIPATMLYNYSASALRGVGDSKHPFYFLFFSSVLNIVLDYIFIVPMNGGVAGAAWATVISQLISGILDMYWLLFRIRLMQGWKNGIRFSPYHAKRLCVVGLPMGFEYSVSAIGAVVMQGAINSLGSVAVAAQTAGEKIRQMFTLPMESVGMGMATFVGQNEGARRYDRIRQGIRDGLIIQWIYCAAAWVVLFFGKTAFTQMVLGEASDQAAALSVEYLSVISCLFCFHGALMILRNTLQGMGYSLHAVLSGVGELIGRAVCGWAAVSSSSFLGICLANPAAWALALAYCTGMTIHFLKQRQTQPC